MTTTDTSVYTPSNDAILPADLDGSTTPAAGAPEPFLMSGESATWKVWRYHVDFTMVRMKRGKQEDYEDPSDLVLDDWR